MLSQRPDPLDAEGELAADHSFAAADAELAPVLDAADFALSDTRRLHHEVWRLAWPSVTTMLLQTVNGLLDVFFVGHLPNSKQALAATGIGGQVFFLLISLAMGISVGTTALVARFTGAQQPEDAEHATAQSLTLSAVLGLVFGLLFWLGRKTIVGWMLNGPGSAESAALCVQFLTIALLSTAPLFVLNTLMGAFRGLGDTRTPMRIQFAMIATHITLNVLLINGRFGFPHLGVRGAATALAASVFVGTFIYLVALVKQTPLVGALHPRGLKLERVWAERILKIGLPASVQAVIRSLGMMSFTTLLARSAEGATSVAALQIGMRAESIAFMPGFGYSVAAAALVGQSLGARDPERAEKAGWAATYQSILVMSVMATVFYIFAPFLSGLFTSDTTVQQMGVDYLRINAFCEPFLALGMALNGALQGAGDTLRPTYITFLTMWVLRLPLAYWLMFSCHLQSRGAWLSMMITTTVGGILTALLFRAGKWKRIKV